MVYKSKRLKRKKNASQLAKAFAMVRCLVLIKNLGDEEILPI